MASISEMNLAEICARQYDWVERMGWHKKTVLESVALIGSEIGEAAGELSSFGEPLPGFGEELADIFLRICDLCAELNIDLLEAIKTNHAFMSGDSAGGDLLKIMMYYADLANAARKDTPNPYFTCALACIVNGIDYICKEEEIDFAAAVYAKMEKNERRGTRGRRI